MAFDHHKIWEGGKFLDFLSCNLDRLRSHCRTITLKNGHGEFCFQKSKMNQQRCGVGEGHCQHSEQCAGDLLCGRNNCGPMFEPGVNCCIDASVSDLERAVAYGTLMLFLGACIVYIGFVFFRRHRLQAACSKRFQMLVNACSTMHKWLHWRNAPVDQDSARLKMLADKRRSKQALAAFHIFVPIIIILSMLTIRHLFMAVLKYDEGTVRLILKTNVLVPMCIFLCFGLFFLCLPHRTTPRGLDTANLVLAAVWIWKTAALADYEMGPYEQHVTWDVLPTANFTFELTFIILCRAMQGMVFGNATLTNILHVVWLVCDTYEVGYRLSHASGSTLDGFLSIPDWYMFRQMAISIGVMALSWASLFANAIALGL